MSISQEISALEAAGELSRYIPFGSRQPGRRLFLTREAARALANPSSAVNTLVGRGFVEAALARWTLNQRIVGNARRGLFLDRLDPPPPEIWELRVTEPTVQGRLLGRFAEPDTLIISAMHTRGMLGKRGSAGWNSAMQRCEATWNQLFQSPPFTGLDISSYVTENCDDFPI